MTQKLIAGLLQLESKTAAFSKVTRYTLALGFLGLGLGAQLALDPWLGNVLARPSVFTAVLLASWYCGVGPAILTAALGYPAVEYLLLDHPFPFVVWEPRYLVSAPGLYLAVCATIIFCVARFRREHDKLRVTEGKLKATEGKLMESEQRIRANFDNAALGIVEVDRNDRFIAVNERLCSIVGYSREELLGMSENDITAPEDRLRTDDFSADLREGRERRLDMEKRYVRRDGSLLWVHVTASPVRDGTGRFLYSVGTIEDIDERKRAHETVSLLSHAIESAPNSIVLTDRKGHILWVNQAFTRLTGYSADEVVAKNPRILKSGRQQPGFYQDLWDTISRGDTWRGELVNRRKDGMLYDEEMTITPVRAQGGDITHFIGLKEDITERKRAEESLRAAVMSAERARAGAEEANQAKDRFLAVLSHELRTPLTPALAAAQLVQRKFDDMRRPLEMICRNIQLEARLIDDLLDLTRIAQGKLALERKPVDVCAVVERAVEICRPDIGARKLHFAVEVCDSPHWVNGDASRLQQVVWNLLTNAVKFTPDGGRIAVRCGRENGHVVIEVADTGIGIDPAEAARIFDAFEQGGRDTTRQFGGLGLGLAIAKRLVEMHEGDIEVRSEGKGRGSTFRVSLPLLAEPETQEGKPAAVEVGPSRRILLVEDNGDTATSMAMLLESFGYQVQTAADVAQALQAIAANGFDLLISDLGLPDRSGIELMQELRASGNELKGIALSGYGQSEDVKRSKNVGFSAHLTKPVDAEGLAETVAGLL